MMRGSPCLLPVFFLNSDLIKVTARMQRRKYLSIPQCVYTLIYFWQRIKISHGDGNKIPIVYTKT